MATPIFSNATKFAQKPTTIAGLFNMAQFDVLKEADPNTNSVAQLLGTDSQLGALWYKNVVRELIHIGGKEIDLNWFYNMFYTGESQVSTKRLFNHYLEDADLNIYVAATRTGTGTVTFQLLKQNHSNNGTTSLPGVGYTMFDKDNVNQYIITAVDTTVPYAHKVTIESIISLTEVITIDANTPYLIMPSNMVGGYSCPNPLNDDMGIGYTQQVGFYRTRKDWSLTIDMLRGTLDKAQYAYIYDRQGQPYWAWDLYEMKSSREALRMELNTQCFIGRPTMNTDIITNYLDADHTGFYGLIPSIQYAGIPKPFSSSIGWNWESDWEPIALYLSSRQRCTDYSGICGLQFLTNMDYNTTKLVANKQVGATVFEAYRRMNEEKSENGLLSHIEKLGVKSYNYRGFNVDLMPCKSLTDERYIGSKQWSNTMIGMPLTGCTENGREVNPLEFYNYGNNGWTGNYEEFYTDHRKTDGCEKLTGYCAQSFSMKLHNPSMWILAQGVADA